MVDTDSRRALSIMAEVQLGKELKKDEVQDIVAFLNTMNGKIASN